MASIKAQRSADTPNTELEAVALKSSVRESAHPVDAHPMVALMAAQSIINKRRASNT